MLRPLDLAYLAHACLLICCLLMGSRVSAAPGGTVRRVRAPAPDTARCARWVFRRRERLTARGVERVPLVYHCAARARPNRPEMSPRKMAQQCGSPGLKRDAT